MFELLYLANPLLIIVWLFLILLTIIIIGIIAYDKIPRLYYTRIVKSNLDHIQ